MRKRIWIGVMLLFCLGVAALALIRTEWFRQRWPLTKVEESILPSNALELAFLNYSEEVYLAAEEFDLPYEYLMALLVLECSGQKPAGSRFENGVYNRLVQVKSGDRRKYEAVKQEHLLEASDEAIRNMATSWGPFQLMGYKCVGMDVNVNDIRGERAVFYGAKWIEEEYGRMLRKSHFKDAFHFHNTGRKHPLVGGPRTHDPNYISRGLRYIEYFKSRKPQ